MSDGLSSDLRFDGLTFGQAEKALRELAAHAEEQYARTCSTGERFAAEFRLLTRDGREVCVLAEARVVRDGDGRPSFLHGVAMDVTAHKEAERVLRRSHDELERLVEQRTAALRA